MRIYVGNLSFNTSDSGLQAASAAHGTVTSAQVIIDRDTQRSRGFGFVEMEDSAQAQAAITALNGKDLDGRQLTVNEARERSAGGGGGGGGGGGPRNDRRW